MSECAVAALCVQVIALRMVIVSPTYRSNNASSTGALPPRHPSNVAGSAEEGISCADERASRRNCSLPRVATGPHGPMYQLAVDFSTPPATAFLLTGQRP